MWLLFVLAWLGLLAVIAIFAQLALGYDLARLLALFSALPVGQRLATIVIFLMALSLIAATIFQAYRLSRSLKSLRDRLRSSRENIVAAHALQNQLDATAGYLVDSDPQQAISSLEKKLAESEQRAMLQQGRNDASDIHDQLAEIRRRQQSLREMVGKVAAERRTVEPIFTEIRDRQHQLERALIDVETDDKKNSLADRLKDMNRDVATLLERVNMVQDSFATLNRHKEELDKSHTGLGPLRAQASGINAVIDELSLSHGRLAKTLDELESSGEQPLSSRLEDISRSKVEVEQRLARLQDNFNVLSAIRLSYNELRERQAGLARSLAELEADSGGASLVDRQNALNEFVIQSRIRLTALQESLATLNLFKEELAKSQSDLIPLQAPVFGIEAVIGEAQTIRDILAKTLGEIEASGDMKLGSRVEALSASKRQLEDKMAQIFEDFARLDSMRKDISGIFTTIRGTLNRIG